MTAANGGNHKTVGILVGGGPAPGINGAIAASVIEARNNGWRVIGIYDGLKWLAEGITTQVIDLDIPEVSRIHLTGGSLLRVSRAGNVTVPEIRKRVLDGLQRLGINALITIGGDGTAYSAALLAEHGAPWLRVVHVPKTIDNDMPLPGGFSTFGFQTARHIGVELVQHVMEDAKTTGRWYLVITMGREAGHLALGIGKSAGATMTLIAEEFPAERVALDDIARPIEGAILRRLAEGRRDGVVVLAEGLAKKLDPTELSHAARLERTQRGDLRLSDLPLGNLLRGHLIETLGGRGIDIGITTKVIGYELRCAPPIPFDAEYVRDLGYGAMHAVLNSGRSGMICRTEGALTVFPFGDFRDPLTGKMRLRFVDTSTESFQVSLHYQIRIRRQDLEDPELRARLAAVGRLTEAELVQRFSACAVDVGGIADD